MLPNNHRLSNGKHALITHAPLNNITSPQPPLQTLNFIPDSRHPTRKTARTEIAAKQEKDLWLPALPAASTSAPPAIVYRNSIECRPYHSALHAFEGSQFGNDFSCESKDFEHWFNAESYFCAAAFSSDGDSSILSLIAMLIVTEESAGAFLRGESSEQALAPFNGNSASPPVIYFSSLAAKNFTQLIPLYKILLKDIDTYKSKNNVAPAWGFSIAATEHGLRYLMNSGFHKTEIPNFLDKYAIVKIDRHSAQSKIWTSIFSQPAPISASERKKKTLTANSDTRLRYRDNCPGGEEVFTAA